MSYMTVLPNSYYPNFNNFSTIPNPYLSNHSNNNTQNVINCLKSALTISLNNYQLNYQSPPSQPQASPQQQQIKNLTQVSPANSLELIQSTQENKEILKVSPPIADTATPMILEDRESKKEPQTLTDDEFLLEDREKGLKKNQVNRRKGKKVKEDPIDDFIVPIPKTDLLETAYLPSFSIAYSDISKKRQEILKRKIGNWNDLGKGKKDKREIRMLCN